jgi:septal ring factor EnvC (AmiA/AmiB activator)
MDENESTSTRSDDTLSVSEGLRSGGQLPVTVPPKTDLSRRILTWLAVGGACLLIGALAVYFGFYVPGQKALKTAQDDLATLQQTLTDTQAELATAESDLAAAQTNAAAAQTELATLQAAVPLLRVQNDVLSARLALVGQDTLTARQMLGLAETDMAALVEVLKTTDPEVAGAIQQRLSDAAAAFARNDITDTSSELRILSENLAILGQR